MKTRTATIVTHPPIDRTPAMVVMTHWAEVKGFYTVRSEADEQSAVEALCHLAAHAGYTHVKVNGHRRAL